MAEPGQPPARAVHAPKLAALHALCAERLSARGRQRLQRHLRACATCRVALEGLQRFEAVAAEAAAAEPEPIAWSRIELAARQQGRALARRRHALRVLPWLGAATAAAAALIALRSTPPRPPSRPAVQIAQVPAPLAVRVTALVGEVRVRTPDGRIEPLTLTSAPGADATIETGAGAEAHLWIEDTARVLIRADSSVRLASLERAAVVLAIARGGAISRVRQLGTRRYEVAAGGYRVEVRGTHFGVRAREGKVEVQLDEGHVAVLSDAGALVADLVAPRQWSSTEAADTPSGRALLLGDGPDERTPLPSPRPPSGRPDWPVLDVPLLPAAAAWVIDGTTLGAGGELRVRVPPGDIELAVRLVDGRLIRTRVHMNPLGMRFDPALLDLGRAPAPQHAKAAAEPGNLDSAAAAAVIRGAEPELQRCYERSLRTTSLAGSVKLRLRLLVDGAGRVRDSELSANKEIPQALADCLREAASELRFPPPGGSGVTFEAPLSFRTRR